VHESIAAALATLAARGVPAERARTLLAALNVHPVLTAHPSEARRRGGAHWRPRRDMPRFKILSRDLKAMSICAGHPAARLSSRSDELEKTGRFSRSGSNRLVTLPQAATRYR
jgi:hypothetical protein